ncbi:dipicolinate synthase subunit DpsA, partial [Desulfofundulus sp.]|uniref:dipicolinate synthase subunit DpsA n=1 Tax=Desulfofundulus sp. TaxID=2282750 RepID=UPI003C76848F
MQPDLKGIKLAVLGGDAREKILVERLAVLGAHLKVVGVPVEGENITPCGEIARALDGVDALILPVPGIDNRGRIHSAYLDKPLFLLEEHLTLLAPGSPVLVGVARPKLKEMTARA